MDQLRLPVQVDPDFSVADSGEFFERDFDLRSAENRKKRFRQVIRDRPQPFSEAGGREEDGYREY